MIDPQGRVEGLVTLTLVEQLLTRDAAEAPPSTAQPDGGAGTGPDGGDGAIVGREPAPERDGGGAG